MSRLRFFLNCVIRVPGYFVIGLVRAYQKFISPLFPPMCRFTPSCSEYFILAVRKRGVIFGSLQGFYRILRCNPWNPGGYDPPFPSDEATHSNDSCQKRC